jgi:hypothetical protein
MVNHWNPEQLSASIIHKKQAGSYTIRTAPIGRYRDEQKRTT